jgi:hypothetical protein
MSNAMRTSGIVACVVLAALAIAGLPNIYTIANLLGIRMAPDWYQSIVNVVSAGGTIAEAFMVVLGIAVPGWALAIVSGLGLASA